MPSVDVTIPRRSVGQEHPTHPQLPSSRSVALEEPIRTGAKGYRGGSDHLRGYLLGMPISSVSQLIDQIELGIQFDSLDKMASQTGLGVEELARLAGIAPRTLARRRTEGRFDPRESERLWRLTVLVEKGIELFEGSIPDAMTWLQEPQKALGGAVPLAFARTEPGAREVENLIGRLEHGVFS
jgi:putative toxin-antitoxin system antitoxin component (TIGR02293 family)